MSVEKEIAALQRIAQFHKAPVAQSQKMPKSLSDESLIKVWTWGNNWKVLVYRIYRLENTGADELVMFAYLSEAELKKKVWIAELYCGLVHQSWITSSNPDSGEVRISIPPFGCIWAERLR